MNKKSLFTGWTVFSMVISKQTMGITMDHLWISLGWQNKCTFSPSQKAFYISWQDDARHSCFPLICFCPTLFTTVHMPLSCSDATPELLASSSKLTLIKIKPLHTHTHKQSLQQQPKNNPNQNKKKKKTKTPHPKQNKKPIISPFIKGFKSGSF